MVSSFVRMQPINPTREIRVCPCPGRANFYGGVTPRGAQSSARAAQHIPAFPEPARDTGMVEGHRGDTAVTLGWHRGGTGVTQE